MAIPLTGSGSIGSRWGLILGRLQDLQSLRGGTPTTHVTSSASYPTTFASINTAFAAGTALPKTMAKAADNPFANLLTWQSAQASLYAWAKQLMADTLGAMVNLDQSLAEDAPISTTAALAYLINQMYGGSLSSPAATFQASTVAIGAQTNVNTPVGNPIFVLVNKNTQGLLNQLPFPETLTFTCTADVQAGAAAGNETIGFAGNTAVADVNSYLYPGGSGAAGSLSLVNGAKSNSTGNALQNSDFFTHTTANVPDNWTLVVGAAGVDVFVDTGNAYTTGGGSLKFLGTGGGLLDAVTQAFNTTPTAAVGAGGTAYALLPNTQYAVNAWIKCSSVPTAGVLEFALLDGGGNVLADAYGTSNLTTFDLTSGGLNVGNTYVNINTTFRTPANLTTQATPFKLRVRLSTAIDSAKSVWVGRLGMTATKPLYAGGPHCAGFSGNVNPLAGLTPDQWTVGVTNDYATTAHGLFLLWLDRIFGTRALGLAFPYAASPTVADSLIV